MKENLEDIGCLGEVDRSNARKPEGFPCKFASLVL